MKTARILLISDETFGPYYKNWRKGTFDGIDLIISCGDLPSYYLSFIATVFHGPVLYVPGNHDSGYEHKPPLGCINIDEQIYTWKGLRFLGLGGSYRYKPGPYQYTEREMKKRIHRLWWKLKRNRGFDILVTHSPAGGIHDGEDLCHKGFVCLRELIIKYNPSYFFHGHVHLNYGLRPRTSVFENTTIVNAYDHYILEIPLPEKGDRQAEMMLLSLENSAECSCEDCNCQNKAQTNQPQAEPAKSKKQK